jgi:hypothetical protein
MIGKTFLCNHLNDDSLIDDVICYVEKEQVKRFTNDQVVEYFIVLREENILKKVKGNVSILST